MAELLVAATVLTVPTWRVGSSGKAMRWIGRSIPRAATLFNNMRPRPTREGCGRETSLSLGKRVKLGEIHITAISRLIASGRVAPTLAIHPLRALPYLAILGLQSEKYASLSNVRND